MPPRTAAKRAAVDKTIVEAASQIPVERLGSAGIGEGIGNATSLLMRLGETINRHYGSKERLSETEIQTYTKLATRTADAMGNLAAAAGEAPLEGLPLPANGHQIIEGVALPAPPPGMVEYLKERG
jgi:hypothetical protein